MVGPELGRETDAIAVGSKSGPAKAGPAGPAAPPLHQLHIADLDRAKITSESFTFLGPHSTWTGH